MANAWIQHVKKYAKSKGVSYGVAMKAAKATYKKSGAKKKSKKKRQQRQAKMCHGKTKMMWKN
mgnify:CR=1 FL=1